MAEHPTLGQEEEPPDLMGDPSFDDWAMSAHRISRDLALLGRDENRTWWEDGECDIHPDSKIYENFFAELSRISRGAWDIQNIEEIWEGDVLQGVQFDWKEQRWQIQPDPQSTGWIDFEVLTPINSQIEDSGLAFCVSSIGDQTTFLVVLTPEEREKLEAARHWQFFEFD